MIFSMFMMHFHTPFKRDNVVESVEAESEADMHYVVVVHAFFAARLVAIDVAPTRNKCEYGSTGKVQGVNMASRARCGV